MTDNHQNLLRLSPAEKKGLKVVFLAKQAPMEPGFRPELDDQCGIEPRYNHELMSSLQELGIKCVPCRSLDDFCAIARDADFVFTIFNRADFRNGEIYVSLQCEKMGIPYLGAPPNIRALAEDKSFAKHLAVSIGLTTPEWTTYGMDTPLLPPAFEGPYFAKPRFGAASDEVCVDSIQEEWSGLKIKIEDLLHKGKEVIVEKCISGTDLTVPVLGAAQPLILDVLEEVSDMPSGISTYRQKRMLDKGRVRRVLEDAELASGIRAQVKKLIAHIRPYDYLRVDFRLCQKTRQAYFLEFNIGCNLGSHAAIMHAASHQSIDRVRVVEHILAYSLSRQKLKRQHAEEIEG